MASPFIFTPKDALDILLVAFLIYLVLVLLRRTHSFFILGGIFVLFAIYSLALLFNLFLTGIILQYFFTFLIIIIVVVFQKEFRNFFEWLFVLGWHRQKRATVPENTVTEILETTQYLADKKRGAIIVLSGIEPINRFLENGIPLNGHLSKTLLLSIFDPSSPGHDGAVVVEGARVKEFGAHLPLADKFFNYKDLGTRHRSALGLSERSDALVVVVSEERGTISLAHHGELTVMKDADELKERLTTFLIQENNSENSWQRWFLQNTGEKVLAFLISLALWILLVLRIKQTM